MFVSLFIIQTAAIFKSYKPKLSALIFTTSTAPFKLVNHFSNFKFKLNLKPHKQRNTIYLLKLSHLYYKMLFIYLNDYLQK